MPDRRFYRLDDMDFAQIIRNYIGIEWEKEK
jgi:hypothetical protein